MIGIKLGIDRICEPGIRAQFLGKRIGLISGASGISSDFRYTIDIFNENFKVTAIYAPEHGSRGVLGPGEKVFDGVDELTGIPVYSLFEDFIFSTDESQKNKTYTPRGLDSIDLMVYDMQDVGSRYFTYVSTLFYCMKACGKLGIPLTVLDRPNPIGGEVEGCLNLPEYSSFIGLTRVPIRHGMTVGELAGYYNGEYRLGCELNVIKLDGWNRKTFWKDTGLPFVKPSPNLPTTDSICVYNGTCMLAGTNVSEGRGTTTPFLTVGAPYINPEKLAKKLNSEKFPGLAFSPAFFMPEFSKYRGQICRGVNIHVIDEKAVKPVQLGVKMLYLIRENYPNDFEFTKPLSGDRYHIDLTCGNTDIRTGNMSAEKLLSKWKSEAESFMPIYQKYAIYD